MADVIVVGAGPTCVLPANELRLHGIDVLVVDKELDPNPMVRSTGLHARSNEILEMRGLLGGLLPQGTKHSTDGFFAGTTQRTHRVVGCSTSPSRLSQRVGSGCSVKPN